MDFFRFIGAFSVTAVVVLGANAYAAATADTVPADDALLRSSDRAPASSLPGEHKAKADAEDCD